jgi:hypothetical protein
LEEGAEANGESADASGAILLIDGKQLVGGAAFDFDMFDLLRGTRSVMVGTLEVPNRPPYTIDFGTSGISTTTACRSGLAPMMLDRLYVAHGGFRRHESRSGVQWDNDRDRESRRDGAASTADASFHCIPSESEDAELPLA